MKLISGAVNLSALIALAFGMAGCHSAVQNQNIASTATGNDSAKSELLKLNSQIFSIPSPVQTVLLIKKGGYAYNKNVLNATGNCTKYDTRFKKALNLGVYGADLSYISLYNQTQDAMQYLASVQKLATDIGVAQSFSAELIKRFQNNMGVEDSLLAMVSEAFRKSDAFFKDNNQRDLSSLIITGGWIEALYIATQENMSNSKDELVRRIGEQKISIQTLLKMLSPYKDKPEYASLFTGLTSLAGDFDNVQFIYNYSAPVVDVQNKTTSVNSTSEVKITPELLKTISDKVQTLRNQIAG
ncbi:MAG: hypothetical protein HKL88_09985 [Bacteroidia bacterium]|jgi:hypothetical protein|nr:hypothetical protein [Bacteroidia bacterium]